MSETMNETPPTASKKKKATTIAGRDLTPQLDAPEMAAVSIHRSAYWCGLVADAPVDQLTCAGINFQKATIYNANGGQHQRLGSIERMDAEQVELLQSRLSRLVVRVVGGGRDDPGPVDKMRSKREDGVGPQQGVEDMARGRRNRWGNKRGYVITIPNAEEIEQRKKLGRPTMAYVRQDGDEPASRYMYAIRCEDQDNPRPGGLVPRTLEDVGIEMP